MDKSIVPIAVLGFVFLLVTIYLLSSLKKQSTELKNLQVKCVRLPVKATVEGIVEGMDKVKILTSTSSDLMIALRDTEAKFKPLIAGNEQYRAEITRMDLEIKEVLKKFTAMSDGIKQHRMQVDMQLHNIHQPMIQPPSHPYFSQPHGGPAGPGHYFDGSGHDVRVAGGGTVGLTPIGGHPGGLGYSDSLAAHQKDCPPPPVDIKFSDDVKIADNLLETTLSQSS